MSCLRPCVIGLFIVLALFSCGNGLPSPSPGSLPSTEFSREAWTDYAEYPAVSLGTDFYVGGWTHTVEPMGYDTENPVYSGTGNDYPFIFPCAESVGGTEQLILTISGNIGFDSALGGGAYVYNQNITSNTGDYSGTYIRPGTIEGYGEGQPDEGAMRGWVYVAWHFRWVEGIGTVVNQYAKFGADGAVVRTEEDAIDGTCVFDGSVPPPPVPERATPVSLCVGGGPRGWARIFMQYVKVYRMASAPSSAEVEAIARRTEPDTGAWADWPLVDASLADVSGNGRTLAMLGSAHAGIAGPDLGD
jgi:hypothetical protein